MDVPFGVLLSIEIVVSVCKDFTEMKIYIHVSFIPYFCLLVFGILVTLVAWFSFHFFIFSFCPSCLAKSKQRLHNIFICSLPKVTRNQIWKMGWTKHRSWTDLTKIINRGNNENYSEKNLERYLNLRNQLLQWTIQPNLQSARPNERSYEKMHDQSTSKSFLFLRFEVF